MNPKISVLMPVYNGGKYLREAVDSVLTQTFTDFELIAINDRSKDGSLEILKSYRDPRIIIINNEVNKGLIATLNIGLGRARGKYVARLDQDDIALRERFGEQYNFMENHREIDVVGSWTECIDTAGKTLKISRNAGELVVIKYEFLFNNVMFHSSIFFRTEVVKRNSGYSQEFVHAEDYEMYSRPGKELRCANLQKVLFKYRIHGDSITGSTSTLPIVHTNALNVAHRNISSYISLSRENFERVKDLLIIKKPNSLVSLSNFIYTLKVLDFITKAFIKKNNLNKKDTALVKRSYHGRRKMIWQHYLIGRFRKFIPHA